ncbi:MAG TPA: Calx-beta domain-containing protein, partial [Candidatus Dormibacteraeota bacterium]|nr:Calx-beta domain-containing protein [Candidatus Dormibacteraeota bacterium]
MRKWFVACVAGLTMHSHAAQPDLTTSVKCSPTPVSVGQLLTYSVNITNQGVVPATSAQLTVSLLSNATVFSVSFSQGTYTEQAGVVAWNVGTLASHASATGEVVIFPAATGSVNPSVNVTEAETDANPVDNSTNVISTVASATFDPGGTMLLARRSHTATLLPNGKVLVTGGITATGTTSMIELYDPATSNFTAAGDLTIPRAYHTATLLPDGRVLLAGNTNAEIYNPATGLSVKTANMITPRTQGHTATLLSNGRVLLAGGYIYFYSTSATEVFDPVSGTFTSGPNLRWSRYGHTSTRLSDNSVFIAGGQEVSYWDVMECDIISPDGLSKIKTTPPIMPSSQAGANLLPDGRVLLSGGWSTFDDAVFFVPTNTSFAAAGKAYDKRWRHISQLLTNGTVLVCAGANGGQTAEILSPATGTFTRTTDLREPRDYAAGVTLPDGRVLVTGGLATTPTGDVYYASTEIYNPSTAKALPLILAQDASAAEDSGAMQFQLQLAAPMGVPVSVDYSTADGSAIAGSDYFATNGTVVFPPGVTNGSVIVPIIADFDYEPTETFSLVLANPTNIFLGLHQVTGFIMNDDPKPAVSVQPASITEGNAYTNFLTFSVVLSAKSFEPITVDYFTSDGTATAAANYFATNGTLNFPPGVTTQWVTVVIRSDIQAGPDRVFYLNLTNATNASIGATHVQGTILNDDGIAGVVDHFDFGPIGSPQHSRVPFPLALTARDALGQTVTNYSGGVTLWGTLTNISWQEYGFEEGDFSQWTPLNLGNTPGPYEISIFDVTGHGIPSRAFRLAANAGAADGIARPINLQGGLTYYISVDLAAFNANGGFPNGDASTAHLLMNGVEFGSFNFNVFGQINALQTFRTNLIAAYTAATTGSYMLSLRFDRGFAQSDVWSYADNVRISAANISPTWAGLFTNGIWSGNFQVNSAMQKVALLAEDVPGHFGTSSVFDVATSANLRILCTNSPSLVRAGSDEVISLTVSNLGPDAATNVLLTNRLSGDLTFRSASPNQGTTLVSGALSVFALGTIASGQKATATVTINPHSLGYFTNTANVVSDLFDGDLTNNLVQSNFLANQVLVHANPLSVNEGNSGTNNASMPLWLEGTVGDTITVAYVITNGTATTGVDYLAAVGNAVFPPNTLTQFVTIPVIGDVMKEPNETVLLNLSPLSTNATLTSTQAVLTILDDDPTPLVTIADVSIVEGNSGTTNAAFQVTLSNPSSSTVNVFASTSDGTALAANDYAATSATITFAAGSTNQVFNVPVMGDINNESNQTFFVTLTNPVNCTISRAVATGTIINDD